MATYQYLTIDTQDALNYDATRDLLNVGGNAFAMTVALTSGGGVNLLLGGRSVTFGSGFLGASSSLFGDNSKLFVGRGNSESVSGTSGRDQIIGNDGADTITGAGGDDSLNGGAGDDSIDGGTGGDIIDGGAGFDVLTLASATAGFVISLVDGTGGEPGDRITNVEGIIGSAFADQITGDSSANLLAGNAGNDLLLAGSGADTLEGGRGLDTMQGGAQGDLFVFTSGDTSASDPDQITDWDSDDLLRFGTVTGLYDEVFVASGTGQAQADALIAQGLRFVAVETPTGVIVYADTAGNGGTAEDAVRLNGKTLADISAANILQGSGPSIVANNIVAGAGVDTISGLGGNDTINGGEGVSYLRGDEGNDSLLGGSAFDDINGNMGDDTVVTGAGDDYCVGGKDNDSLSGGAGADLVYGNLGHDYCDGGDGNDIVRGGQENDICLGGNGDDFVSGDKGDDTMTGGAGADIFHSFGDAGLDRVTDFNLAQGDRVQLDPGTQFTVSQVGADTVIDMTGGGRMILVGVQMSTLTPGWIFGA